MAENLKAADENRPGAHVALVRFDRVGGTQMGKVDGKMDLKTASPAAPL